MRLTTNLTTRLESHLAHAGDSGRRRVFAAIDAFVAKGESADPSAVAAWVLVGSESVRQTEVRALYSKALAGALERLKLEIGGYLREEGKTTRNASKIAAAVLATVEGSYQLAVGAPKLLPEGFAAPMLRRMVEGLVAAEEPSS